MDEIINTFAAAGELLECVAECNSEVAQVAIAYLAGVVQENTRELCCFVGVEYPR